MSTPDDETRSHAGNDELRTRQQRRRAKNVTLLLVLVAFVVLIYVVSIVRMSGG